MLTDLPPASQAAGDVEQEQAAAAWRVRIRPWLPDRGDFVAGALYLLGGVWVMYHVLRHPRVRVQRDNANDEALFQWMLAHGARVLSHGDNPFFSHQMNMPDGVNLMANTSVLGLSIPLAPVTLVAGPGVAYALMMLLALVLTAYVWYHVLYRHLIHSRIGAVIGGLFGGFAPGMISHATGHPNIVAQFLIPLVIWRAVRLREPGRAVRNGVVLGLLVTWQAFINEEILLVTALSLGLFVAVYALIDRRALAGVARPALRGLLVAVLVAGVLLAYPLYFQFFGPQSYHGLGYQVRNFGADVTSFIMFGSQSLGGSGFTRGHFAQNASEENSFLGLPLVVLLITLAWWLRRYAAVRALAVVAVAFAVLSLGPKLLIHGRHTRIPAPFALLNHLPLFDTMVPTRLALAVIPVVAILLALGHREMMAVRDPAAPAPLRLVWFALLAAALVPLVPRPLPATGTLPTPAFVTAGLWRRYVPAGHSMVAVPPAGSRNAQPMMWSARTGLQLPIARGYFLGPGTETEDSEAIFGAPKRPTSIMLEKVLATGEVPKITAKDRANALDDLRYWRSSVVVLQPHTWHDGPLWETVTDLLGFAPTLVGGVWLWDVRTLVQ